MRTTRIHVVINTHTFTFFDVILAFTTDVSGSGSDTFTFLQKKYFKLSGPSFDLGVLNDIKFRFLLRTESFVTVN